MSEMGILFSVDEKKMRGHGERSLPAGNMTASPGVQMMDGLTQVTIILLLTRWISKGCTVRGNAVPWAVKDWT